MPGRFLTDAAVVTALTKLAEAPELTIFVGAGASMEVGLPSWPALVDRLLERVARDRGLDEEGAVQFSAAVRAEVDGVIGAATVVRAHFNSEQYRGDANEFIRADLYRDADGRVVARQFGPTARAVAKLVEQWPLGKLEVVTTNYDLLLEMAIDEMAADRSPDGVHGTVGAIAGQGGDQVLADRLVVRHLHGALDVSGDSSSDLRPVVLAEGDYQQVQGEDSWQRNFMLGRLMTSTCVFVGASMTDVNVLRFLRLANAVGGSRQHFALLTRQPASPSIEEKFTEALRDSAQARWAEFSVEVLYPDYFLETSQFLEELVRRRRAVNLGMPADQPEDRYRARLARWQAAMLATTMPVTPLDKFIEAQDRANDALAKWLAEFVKAMPGNVRADCTRETFGLQLWTVQDEGASLLLWAQSTNSWRDPRVFEPIPASLPSQWGAVQSYCAGSPFLQVLSETIGSRWRSVLNVPVYLDDDKWGRLPVGVLSLSAMHRHGVAILLKLEQDALDALVNVMVAAAAEYFNPDGVDVDS
jgi:hypothetical protein